MHNGARATEGNGANKEKCSQLAPEEADALFFPPPGGKSKAAKLFCSDCPVIDTCLKNQLRLGGPGFWAGTTESERARMVTFLGMLPAELDDFVPPVKRNKVRRIVKEANILGDPLYDIEGPSPEEELKMLEGLV